MYSSDSMKAMFYILTQLCYISFFRFDEGYVYQNPATLPIASYVFYTISNFGNLTWILLFDREYMIAGLVVIALTMAFCLSMATGISFRALDK